MQTFLHIKCEVRNIGAAIPQCLAGDIWHRSLTPPILYAVRKKAYFLYDIWWRRRTYVLETIKSTSRKPDRRYSRYLERRCPRPSRILSLSSTITSRHRHLTYEFHISFMTRLWLPVREGLYYGQHHSDLSVWLAHPTVRWIVAKKPSNLGRATTLLGDAWQTPTPRPPVSRTKPQPVSHAVAFSHSPPVSHVNFT